LAGAEPAAAEAEFKALQGVWTCPYTRAPDVSDATIHRTLEIGAPGKPDSVRLVWAMYCGQTRITSGVTFAGRITAIEAKGKKRLLTLVDAKGGRQEIEFAQQGDTLRLEGTLNGVDLGVGWIRRPAKDAAR
jgi:hypothetical protein